MTPSEIDWHVRHYRSNLAIVATILACPVCFALWAVARAMGLP